MKHGDIPSANLLMIKPLSDKALCYTEDINLYDSISFFTSTA